MVPSIGFEPMTFPMSRERATAAPTGLKSFFYYLNYHNFATTFPVGAFPRAGTYSMLQALRQLGLNRFFTT